MTQRWGYNTIGGPSMGAAGRRTRHPELTITTRASHRRYGQIFVLLAGMSNEVGVEPERLAELAAALENLRGVLADNVPVIVNMLE